MVETGELEAQLQKVSGKIVLECMNFLNYQWNLIFINVPDDSQPSEAISMIAVKETLQAFFQMLGISNPFPSIKKAPAPKEILGHMTRTMLVNIYHNRSVGVVLNKSVLLMRSTIHCFGIVLDMPSPQLQEIAHALQPNRQFSVILDCHTIAVALTARSLGTNVQD